MMGEERKTRGSDITYLLRRYPSIVSLSSPLSSRYLHEKRKERRDE